MKKNNKNATILPLISGAKLFLIVLVVLLAGFAACKKETDIIGLDVQPPNDILGVDFQDTTTLITKTERVDSLRTDETLIITGDAMIGSYWDPVFGKTHASLYTQLRLTTLNPLFGTSPQIDSVVLSIVYNPVYYGKRDRVKQKINIYQVTEDIKTENTYYSHQTLATGTIDLANSYEFTPYPTDSVHILGKPLKPQLRIPLDNNFGQDLLTQPNTVFETTAGFQTYMKGLYVTTENSVLNSEEGNILYFKCGDEQSKLTIYYRNDTDDSLSYDFALGGVARFSHFSHDYSVINSDLAAQLSTTPPAQNDVVFLQSMAGLRTKIEMPYLMNWLNSGKIAINKAELVVKIDTNSMYQLDTFAAPAKLVLFGINDDGTTYVLPDAGETVPPNYFGGSYSVSAREYRFNIARYIQQLLTEKKKNNGLYLLAGNGAVNANRVVIGGGGGGSAYQMKLAIAYTKLE